MLVLGLDGSGKTSIVQSFKRDEKRIIAPTVGFEISTITRLGLTLNIWDVGGQKTLRPFWYNYLDRTDCVVWVVDSGALERLQESFEEFSKLLSEDRMAGAGILILANKCDTIEDGRMVDVVTLVTELLQLQTISNHTWEVMPVSAKTGYQVEEAVDWIVDEAKLRLYAL